MAKIKCTQLGALVLAVAASVGCTADTGAEQAGVVSEAGRCRPCDSEVTVEIVDCGIYDITCNRDISNIVYRVGGVDTKIDSLSGHNFTLEAGDVTDVWVKCGSNASGDGPGYGERFSVDDSALCEAPTGMCDFDEDCATLSCGEGGFCTSSVGGRVFMDADGNGTFTAGDSGAIAGVYLQVNVAAGWVDFGFDVTDASGFYNFGILNASFEYRIRVIAPPGETFVYTTQNVGADDTIDSDVDAAGISDAVLNAPDVTNTTVWAGILP